MPAGERRQQLKWLASGAAIAVSSILLGVLIGSPVPLAGLAALPAALGVAILKYRLYDIDRLISRTLAYAIITGLLAGVYAGLVLLATQLLHVHTPVAVAASTLAARLKDAVDLDSVRDDLATVGQEALEPAHLSVWVSRRT